MEVEWLAKALSNLDDEAEFVAKDNPVAARALVKRIHEAVDRLKSNPALGRPGRMHGTREHIVPGTRYIIPYRVRPQLNRVEILRILHTSRRLPENG